MRAPQGEVPPVQVFDPQVRQRPVEAEVIRKPISETKVVQKTVET